MITFAAAREHVLAAFDARHIAASYDDPRARRRAQNLCDKAYEEALTAFATEILPTVLIGDWKLNRGGAWRGPLRDTPRSSHLLDHVSCFLQRGGSRGRHQYAYLAEPYQKPDLPTEPVLHAFARDWGGYMRAPLVPVTMAIIPLGKDASRWFPGATLAFVIAKPELLRTPLPATKGNAS